MRDQAARAIVDRIMKPRLAGVGDVTVSVRRSGPTHSALSFQSKGAVDPGFNIVGFDADGGTAFDLRRALEKVWEYEYFKEHGKWPARQGMFLPYYLAGLAADRPTLEALGLEGVTFWNGWKTWDEAESEYRAMLARYEREVSAKELARRSGR